MSTRTLAALVVLLLASGCPAPEDKEKKPEGPEPGPKVEVPGGLGELLTKGPPLPKDELPAEEYPAEAGEPESGDPLTDWGYPGPPIGSPKKIVGASFRAATWNLFKMTRKKAANLAFPPKNKKIHPNPFKGRKIFYEGKQRVLSGDTKARVIFQILKAHSIDIIGFQEVYLARREAEDTADATVRAKRTAKEKKAIGAYLKRLQFTERPVDHPLLGPTKAGKLREIEGYQIVPGEPIYSYQSKNQWVHDKNYPTLRYKWHWREFAPIAYLKSKFKSGKSRIVPQFDKEKDPDKKKKNQFYRPRGTHLLDVTFKPRKKDFVFASTHFPPAADRGLGSSIEELPDLLAKTPDIIIALDANSSPHGHQQRRWKDAGLDWIPKVGGNYTKIHKKVDKNTRAESVHVHGDKLFWKIDDVISHGKPRLWYIKGSKEPVAVDKLPLKSAKQQELLKFLKLSDHVIVKSDHKVH